MAHKKAFTMVELMMVVIIISIIAGFGIPSFTRGIDRARARDASNNLTIIHSSNVIFRVRNGANFAGANLAAINAMNGAGSLNIIANGVTYSCAGGVTCTGIATNGSFTVTATLGTVLCPLNDPCAPKNPACVGAACP